MTKSMRAATTYPMHSTRFRSIVSPGRHAQLASMNLRKIDYSAASRASVLTPSYDVHQASCAVWFARCGYATRCP